MSLVDNIMLVIIHQCFHFYNENTILHTSVWAASSIGVSEYYSMFDNANKVFTACWPVQSKVGLQWTPYHGTLRWFRIVFPVSIHAVASMRLFRMLSNRQTGWESGVLKIHQLMRRPVSSFIRLPVDSSRTNNCFVPNRVTVLNM